MVLYPFARVLAGAANFFQRNRFFSHITPKRSTSRRPNSVAVRCAHRPFVVCHFQPSVAVQPTRNYVMILPAQDAEYFLTNVKRNGTSRTGNRRKGLSPKTRLVRQSLPTPRTPPSSLNH